VSRSAEAPSCNLVGDESHKKSLTRPNAISSCPACGAHIRLRVEASQRTGTNEREQPCDNQKHHFTGEELQVKFLWDYEGNSLRH
jgi:hypothetical protein